MGVFIPVQFAEKGGFWGWGSRFEFSDFGFCKRDEPLVFVDQLDRERVLVEAAAAYGAAVAHHDADWAIDRQHRGCGREEGALNCGGGGGGAEIRPVWRRGRTRALDPA